MNEHWSTSTETATVTYPVEGRISRATLGLLLNTCLVDSLKAGRMSGLARLQRATDGLSSAARAYEQAELISSALAREAAIFQMWLTQYATINGFLLGSGEHPLRWSSSRTALAEIASTSVARDQLDAAAFTTKRGRARELTLWVLGDGKFNRGTSLETLWDKLYYAENILRSGYQVLSENGSSPVAYPRPGRRLYPENYPGQFGTKPTTNGG